LKILELENHAGYNLFIHIRQMATEMQKIYSLAALIILLILTISCVNKEVTETYYETENRQESYTTTEPYENLIPHKGDNPLSKNAGRTAVDILLNRTSDNNVRWAIVTASTQNPLVRTFAIQQSGKNHRISVSLSEGYPNFVLATMLNRRSPEGVKLGFQAKPLTPEQRAKISPFWTSAEDITVASQFGFSGPGGDMTFPTSTGPGYFSFDDLFNTSGWALISIFYASSAYSVDYVWDEVRVETKEVTKYRDIPAQVEKQRTVIQKVPFWEVIFD